MTEKASSAMCSVCHSTNIGPVVGIAKDFETSKQAERGRSCIGCHMQAIERQSWVEVLATSVISTLLVYFLFTRLLGTTLPRGLLDI